MATQTTAPNSRNRLIGRGYLVFSRHDAADDGTRAAFTPLGNCPDFTISTEVTSTENKSSMHSDSRVLDTINVSSTVTFSMSCQEFNQRNLAMALLGDEADYTQTVATGASVELVNTTDGGIVLGAVYDIGYYNITSLSLADQTNSGPLVEGTDWEWVPGGEIAGAIRILPDGNATAGDTLTATVSAPAIVSGEMAAIQGGAETKINGTLYFYGDPAYGPKIDVKAWKVSVKPQDAIALIGTNDIGTFRLTLTALDDSSGIYGGSDDYPLYKMVMP